MNLKIDLQDVNPERTLSTIICIDVALDVIFLLKKCGDYGLLAYQCRYSQIVFTQILAGSITLFLILYLLLYKLSNKLAVKSAVKSKNIFNVGIFVAAVVVGLIPAIIFLATEITTFFLT